MLVDVRSLIAAEFREMPGMRLTLAQACRLWDLDAATCESTLMALVDAKVLHRTPHGHFAALPNEARPLRSVMSTPRRAAAS